MTNPALAYHEYLGPAMFAPMARVTLDLARPQPGERVLDVACGTGIVTSQLPALVGAGGKVVGLDLNAGMLAVARAQASAIEWKEGDGAAMELGDASFDLVICQHGLQFFPDRAAGAREMRRVLARGGRAVVACWQGLERQTFMATLIRAEARHLNVTEAHVGVPWSFGDPDALRGVFLAAGFSDVDVEAHTIDARFPEPEKFIRMAVTAATAFMPDRFAGVDLEPLMAAVAAECADDFARYRDGGALRFPMPTNVVVAKV